MIKLDLGCGQHPARGFLGVDIYPKADIVCDLFTFPWMPIVLPNGLTDDEGYIKGEFVEELHSSHFVEHIPMTTTDDGTDLLCAFMNEAHRVLAPGGRFTIVHPHSHSDRSFQDPTHRRFIPAATWSYFDQQWLEGHGLSHYPITADFTVFSITEVGKMAGLSTRTDWNSALDLHVVLIRR